MLAVSHPDYDLTTGHTIRTCLLSLLRSKVHDHSLLIFSISLINGATHLARPSLITTFDPSDPSIPYSNKNAAREIFSVISRTVILFEPKFLKMRLPTPRPVVFAQLANNS